MSDHWQRDPGLPGHYLSPDNRPPYPPPPPPPVLGGPQQQWPMPNPNLYPPAVYPTNPPYPAPTYGPPWPPPARRSRTWPWLAAAAVVVLGAVTGLVVWLVAPSPARSGVALTDIDDGVRIGYPTAPITIDIFDEPICPPCSQFVTSSSADLQRAVNAGKIVLRYHLLNFLDGRSASGDYSTRAVAATACVAEAKDPTVYANFYVDLFASNFQPAERATTDRTDAELAHLAQSVGAPEGVTDCITSHRLVEAAKRKASNAQTTLQGLNSEITTPQVFNGTTKVDESSPGWVDGLMKSS